MCKKTNYLIATSSILQIFFFLNKNDLKKFFSKNCDFGLGKYETRLEANMTQHVCLQPNIARPLIEFTFNFYNLTKQHSFIRLSHQLSIKLISIT